MTVRIKEARMKSGMPQWKVAKMLGTTQNAFSQWETGKHEPDYKTLVAMAKIFGVSVDYLLEVEEPSATEDDIKVALFGGDGEVTDEMWEEVKRFAEFVKQNRRNK